MRTLDDMPISSNSWPAAGKHVCRCVGTKRSVASTGTAAVVLTLTTQDSAHQFEDYLYVTAPAIGRLVIAAKRLCQMPKDAELPDEDAETAKVLARYILDNGVGKDALVEIIEESEERMVTAGPHMGEKRPYTRHRVAFGGYEVLPEANSEPAGEFSEDDVDSIPF